jgi:non-heme chloroperoxidase
MAAVNQTSTISARQQASAPSVSIILAALAMAIAAPLLMQADALHRAAVNGTTVAWVEEGSGPAVVFVHGSGADLRTWGYQMTPVARASFRAIAYSRRFHHPNDPPAGDESYTAAQHASDLASFIDSLDDAGTAHVVASSSGGAVALLVARDRPALVRSLFLTEPALFALLPSGSPEAAQAAHLDGPRRLLAGGDVHGALHAFIDVIIGPGAWQKMPESARQMLSDNLPELRREAAMAPGDPPFGCADARRVVAPVRLVTGGSSPAFFKAINERLAECLPSVETVIVPGAAHAVHAQQPARFNELLVEFLMKRR